MSLTNGCVCCSIGSGFLETLGGLLDSGERFERIVIEASGVGDPWRIAEIALIEPGLRLDGVLVIADASRIEALVDDRRVGETVRNQFAKCDVALLSKSDLVARDMLNAAQRAIRAIRKDVRIEVLSPDMKVDSFLATAGKKSTFRADGIEDSVSDHEEGFKRWTYRRSGAFDRGRLASAMDALPPQLLRLKGACHVDGERAPLVLQMVSGDWSLSSADRAGEDRLESITLVGVGTEDLPPDGVLEAILDGALM
jgi:G3E family GTPase